MKKEVAKRPPHRPRKFESVDELQNKIESYYKNCEKREAPLSLAGLAYALNCDRRTILNYESKTDIFDKSFFPTIKRAKDRILQSHEEGLLSGRNPAGHIFLLKANYDYKEEININQTNYTLKTFKPATEPKMIEIPNEKK